METEIKIFISYLHNTKRMSGNTVVSYERDLKKMMQYFQEAHQITRVQDITETSLNSYMLYLEKNHFAGSGSASSSAVGQDAERIAGSGNAGTVVCHRNPGQ